MLIYILNDIWEQNEEETKFELTIKWYLIKNIERFFDCSVAHFDIGNEFFLLGYFNWIIMEEVVDRLLLVDFGNF